MQPSPSVKAVHVLSTCIGKVAMSRTRAVGTNSTRTHAPRVLQGAARGTPVAVVTLDHMC